MLVAEVVRLRPVWAGVPRLRLPAGAFPLAWSYLANEKRAARLARPANLFYGFGGGGGAKREASAVEMQEAARPSSIRANPSRGGDAKLWALNRPEGGADKAARLPKGWTGPVSMSGRPGFRIGSPDFLLRDSQFGVPPVKTPLRDLTITSRA